jgi:membrane-associated phospholipid phosphatase
MALSRYHGKHEGTDRLSIPDYGAKVWVAIGAGVWWHAFVLISVAGIAYFCNLGISLFEGSEGLYAHITHEMVQRGDYVHLTYQGEPYTNKPPFATSFAVAAVFADRYEQPVPLITYTPATIISLSRIYQNEHFASDVFAGAALGLTLGKVLSWRHQQENQRWTVLPFAPKSRGRGSRNRSLTANFSDSSRW